MTTTGELPQHGRAEGEIYREVQQSAEFAALRRRLRWFIFPMSAAFLLWYGLFVVVADFAPGFMSYRLTGQITVALVFGLLQFASTFLITTLYVRFADRRVDPEAERIRRQVEWSLL